MGFYGGWAPYVSVHERRERALWAMEKLRKKGRAVEGVQPRGRNSAPPRLIRNLRRVYSALP